MSSAAKNLVPTRHLRFIDRNPGANYNVHTPSHVLQQWWEEFGERAEPCNGEWRDVPAVVEGASCQ